MRQIRLQLIALGFECDDVAMQIAKPRQPPRRAFQEAGHCDAILRGLS
jgi:hypothetical protein